MPKILVILLLFLHYQAFSQDSLSIRQWYEQGEYQKGVLVSQQKNALMEEDAFYAGMCYSAMQQDEKAVLYFEQAVAFAPYNPTYWFYVGLSASLTNQLDKATEALTKAVSIRNDDARFFGLLGDVYTKKQNYEAAYQAFSYAIRLPNCSRHIFSMLADLAIYQPKLPIQSALLQAKNDSEPLSSNYRNALFFLADLQMKNQPQSADSLLAHLTQLDTTDYWAMVKRIQLSLRLKKYEQATAIKQFLYRAYQNQSLPPKLSEEICIEEYEWRGKEVLVYERFNENNTVYIKYLFYVMNENHRVDYILQVEHSPAVESADNHYVIGKIQQHKHYTYHQFTLPKNIIYPDLKEKMLQILEGKTKPTSVIIWEGGN